MAADDEGCRSVEADTSELLGHGDADQPELARPLKQPAGQRSVFLVESLDCGDVVVFRDLARCLRDQPTLFGEPLRRQSARRVSSLEQPCRALHATRSRIPAAPMPPPTHRVTRPYLA